MAPLHLTSAICILVVLTSLLIPAMKSETFSRKLSKTQMGLRKEKLTHLHFYFHDIHSGKNPTAIKIVDAAAPTVNTTRTGFGTVFIMDNALTVGPNLSSKSVGRAQGMYASAGIEDLGLLMVMNYNFLEGTYNGSTLSILGRNPAFMPVREMPIVGGSGLFRYARGYAQAKTYSFDFYTGDACVEYNVYVFHY